MYIESLKILENVLVAEKTYKLILEAKNKEGISSGKFIMLQLENKLMLLKRPFCIADYDGTKITIYYQIVGVGTDELSKYKENMQINCMYPLGNGFPRAKDGDTIMIISGGLGAALLPLFVRENKEKQIYSYIGFQNKDKVIKDIENLPNVKIATDDGSYQNKGYITEIADNDFEKIKPDLVLCCGPEAMYKAIERTKYIKKANTYISLERRMGCGLGACLVCNCRVKVDGKEEYLRACKDGPIFRYNEVVF